MLLTPGCPSLIHEHSVISCRKLANEIAAFCATASSKRASKHTTTNRSDCQQPYEEGIISFSLVNYYRRAVVAKVRTSPYCCKGRCVIGGECRQRSIPYNEAVEVFGDILVSRSRRDQAHVCGVAHHDNMANATITKKVAKEWIALQHDYAHTPRSSRIEEVLPLLSSQVLHFARPHWSYLLIPAHQVVVVDL